MVLVTSVSGDDGYSASDGMCCSNTLQWRQRMYGSGLTLILILIFLEYTERYRVDFGRAVCAFGRAVCTFV